MDKLMFLLGLLVIIILMIFPFNRQDILIYHKQDDDVVWGDYGFQLEDDECLYVNEADYTDFFIKENCK